MREYLLATLAIFLYAILTVILIAGTIFVFKAFNIDVDAYMLIILIVIEVIIEAIIYGLAIQYV